MKYISLTFFILLLCQSAFSQSKKEQIETLIHQKDSLGRVLEKERQLNSDQVKQLEIKISKINSDMVLIQKEFTELKSELAKKEGEILKIQGELGSREDTILSLKAELIKFKFSSIKNILPKEFLGYWVDSLENCEGQLGLGIFNSDGELQISSYSMHYKDVKVKDNHEYFTLSYIIVSTDDADSGQEYEEEKNIKMSENGSLIIFDSEKKKEIVRLVKCDRY